jgi:uncharacterized integral membrane protein (TIGR00698 family)
MSAQANIQNRHDYNIMLAIFPGVLAALTIAMVASFLSEHYGGPVMLLSLLLGIAFNFSNEPGGRCIPGIEFSSTIILRTGVALLGLRISFAELNALGFQVIALVVVSVFATITFGVILARMMGLDRQFGLLTGAAVAICGASAAMAMSAVLPKHADSDRNTIFTVVGVTALSTIAMIIYPIIVALLKLDNSLAGIFLGATIHDVAQVVGAGYMVSEQSGDVATLVKLMRVAMLVPIIFLVMLFVKNNSSDPDLKQTIPFFLVGFIILMLAANLLAIPSMVVEQMIDVSRWCLLVAIAALGMKTSLKQLAEVGPKAISLIMIETLFLAILVLLITSFFW